MSCYAIEGEETRRASTLVARKDVWQMCPIPPRDMVACKCKEANGVFTIEVFSVTVNSVTHVRTFTPPLGLTTMGSENLLFIKDVDDTPGVAFVDDENQLHVWTTLNVERSVPTLAANQPERRPRIRAMCFVDDPPHRLVSVDAGGHMTVQVIWTEPLSKHPALRNGCV